jgi:hypothetical protein
MDLTTDSAFSLPVTSGLDGCVIKFNTSGAITGVTTFPCTNSSSVQDMVTDSVDNLYIVGNYVSTTSLTFTNLDISNTSSGITMSAPTNAGAFLVKFNSTGIAQGVSVIDGGLNESGTSICVDTEDNVYVTGAYISSFQAKNIATTTSNSIVWLSPSTNMSNNIYIVKWDASGNVVYASKVCDTAGSDVGRHICCDKHNNLYIVGQLGINTTASYVHNFSLTGVSQSQFTLPITSTASAFIVKYNQFGLVTAASAITGTVSDTTASRRRVVVDAAGIVFFGGSISTGSSIGLSNLDGTATNFSIATPTFTTGNTGFIVRYTTDVLDVTSSAVNIYKNTTVNGNINFTGNLTQNGVLFSGSAWNTSGSNLYIGADSNVGIGLSNPSYQLQVLGDIHATGDIIAFSDRRYKTNLSVIPTPLEKLSQLYGYTYNFVDNYIRHTGVIAQEVQQVLPEAVRTDNEGKLSVAYGNMAGLFIESIKELNTKHEKEMASMHSWMSELQKEIDDLRQACISQPI